MVHNLGELLQSRRLEQNNAQSICSSACQLRSTVLQQNFHFQPLCGLNLAGYVSVAEWQQVEQYDLVWSTFFWKSWCWCSLLRPLNAFDCSCAFAVSWPLTSSVCVPKWQCQYLLRVLTTQSVCICEVCLSVWQYFPLDHHLLLLSGCMYQVESHTSLQLGGNCDNVLELKYFQTFWHIFVCFCHMQQI